MNCASRSLGRQLLFTATCLLAFGKSSLAEEPPPIFGVVRTAAGDPAEEVDVWLVAGQYDEPVTIRKTKTDRSGQFRLTDLADEESLLERNDLQGVWARAASGELGWFQAVRSHRRQSITLQLQKTGVFRGQVVDREGTPIGGASLQPEILTSRPVALSDPDYGRLPSAMRRQLTATTDSEGWFEIADLPANGAVYVTLTASGFGQPRIKLNLNEPMTVRLGQSARLSGSVQWPPQTKRPNLGNDQQIGQLMVRGMAAYDANGGLVEPGKPAAYQVSYYTSIPIDAAGRFEWKELPPLRYTATATYDHRVPVRASGASLQLDVEPGQDIVDLPLPVERAFRIEGQVLSLLDKKPIAGAGIQLYQLADGTLRYEQRVTTDKTGRYVAHAPRGSIRIEVHEAPDAYVPLAGFVSDSKLLDQRRPTLDVRADMTWPDLLLDPAVDVRIHVVDEDGTAVSGAIVKVVTPAGNDAQRPYGTEQLTDANGEYLIERVAANDTLPIQVRTPDAISEHTLVVTPQELDGPVQVKLSASHGFRFQGRVLDTQGQPISGADVKFGTVYEYISKWNDRGMAISGSAGSCRTDANGFFTSGPLWPDRAYRVYAQAEGFSDAEAPQSVGSLGGTTELEPLVLQRAQAPAAGIVVDTHGMPLEGVRVFGGGAKWRMAETHTDAAGKFLLDGLASDPYYLFADLDGFRLGGIRLGHDQRVLKIVLRGNDEPPRGIRRVEVPDRPRQLQIVRQLVERAWTLPTHPRSTARIGQLEALVQADPDLALAMSKAAGGAFDYVVRAETAKRCVYSDPDRALRLLRETMNWRGFATALKLGRELALSNDDADLMTAKRIADLTVEMAEQMKPPTNYPRVARLLALLGDHGRAQKLVEEASEAVKRGDDNSPVFLKRTAIALAPYDLETAESFVAQMKEGYEHLQTRAEMAVAIARVDPEGCMRLAAGLRGRSSGRQTRDQARLQIAREFADEDLDAAIQLVRECEELSHRAQALGWFAVDVAEIDRRKAWQLIDEALAVHRAAKNAYQSWSNYGEGGPFAAALAYHAKQVGYPDMESVILHVLVACRAKGNVTKGQDRLRATIQTARILGLVDTGATRQLLESIAREEGQIERGKGNVSLYDQWLQAWLLVDFDRGAALLAADLQRLANSGEEDPLRYGHGAVFRLLAAAPHERFDVIAADETGIWKRTEF